MYFDKYFPFYEAYASPLLYQGERMQEEEFELMKSYYPETVRRIQEQVEEECDLLDYEGSRLYDEYPDKYMFYHLCRYFCFRRFPEDGAADTDAEDISEISDLHQRVNTAIQINGKHCVKYKRTHQKLNR